MFVYSFDLRAKAKATKAQQLIRDACYDSLIVSAAIQAGCDRLYTEDLQHGQKFAGLQVVNPFL